ncbi:1-(5-phosphoribosyl)-5-amino-4-imidazole-carboxylate carboxylase [Leptolyngbya sp. 'hensonii']|uniref:nickel pincer cofactor biosynthesis protein LarB n=1 Tax=Leptolyngbya sp. 'hensonii' TaxID=1922337 RepID=UPI0009500D3C|nr:nickel pincer cofactor biosynthesis protein LarB [Leptolyngbya sp. 'hensonii']OLP17890.1 1-(5-phosphoribosyl)-5-amino-4-imidazole-carboxylate carboxylase [Leptolyngbya sp. 'hensonii']
MFSAEDLRSLLDAVATGRVSPDTALDRLKHFDFEPVDDFAKVDHHRALRTGFPEVIWGPGKTSEQLVKIFGALRQRNPVVMATRIELSTYHQLRWQIPDLQYFDLAQICAIAPLNLEPRYSGLITLVSAGTADIPIAEEAAVTAQLSGFQVKRLWDVGVSGIHRLLSNRDLLSEADVLIVVAGMEGALPSVVAGLAACPVIAVPTSVGYGASLGGLAPLLTMLNSCAAGVGVVNIDNGFGAGILAGQILRTAQRLNTRSHPSHPSPP